MVAAFLAGLGMGLAVAVPVGPVAVLCVQRTLARGLAAGLPSALGAGSADAGFALVALLGLEAMRGWLLGHQNLLRASGGLFLVFLGVTTALAVPRRLEVSTRPNLLANWISAFFLTLTNPTTILSFAAVLAAAAPTARSPELVAGVLVGSSGWYAALAGAAHVARAPLMGRLRVLNGIAGVVLAGAGVALLVSALA
jgi:threonine/homoserine/homoserine lactone efflux protein